MDEFRLILDDGPGVPLALVFTDAQGRVISLRGSLLELMQVDDPGSLIGLPLHTILGIEAEAAQQLFDRTAQQGGVVDWPLDIYLQPEEALAVQCGSIAARDDQGAFIGADITLHRRETHPVHDDSLTTQIQQAQKEVKSEEDQALLRLYVSVQLSALHVLLARLAGLRVAESLETTINKIAVKRKWPLSISGDRLSIQSDEIPADVYHALLSETIRFVSNVIGRRTVVTQMRAVDERMSARAIELAQETGLHHLF